MKIVDIGTHFFIDKIMQRISRNKNFLLCFVGETGSGKSYSGLALAEYLSQKMNVPFSKENIVFSPRTLMQRINEGDLPKGSCLLFDESGVSYSARQWQSINNQLINYLIETFRFKNYIVIFTVPSISFIDKVARQLIHCICETVSINYAKKFCEVKPFFIQVSRFCKAYYKYLKVATPGAIVSSQIQRLQIYLPSKELIEHYEKVKNDYVEDLYKMIEEGLEMKKPGLYRKPGRPRKMVKEIEGLTE